MKAERFYNTAIYLRLSRDDMSAEGERMDGGKTESESISSQRDMLCAYVRKQKDMKIYDIYVDDGFTGTNFDRPAFKRMMRDIEAGKVTCVIVKDLSRLGRDYIEAGRLIQKTFPAFSVRFIALTDQFDSLTADYNEMSFVVPIKNFVNDSYSRDISCKVRSHQRVKRENGEFIGAFAVYGYKKSDENRNLLVPDAYAAAVVRKIFAWKREGYSNFAIAARLDQAGVLSPLEYKKLHGEKLQTGFVTGVRTKWSPVAVKRILTNENYTGALVQGKEEKVNYKIKKTVRKSEKEWIRAEGAHEAIVSGEDFKLVQELLKTDIHAGGGKKSSHCYAGMLFCADCLEPMLRRVNRYKGKEKCFFICATKNRGAGCSRHAIAEETLHSLVLTVLRQQLALFFGEASIQEESECMEKGERVDLLVKKEIESIYRERDKYVALGKRLEEDLERQIITKEDFNSFQEIFALRSRELGEAAQKQEQLLQRLVQRREAAAVNWEQLKKMPQIEGLDRTTAVTLVKRILVYEGKRVYIEFRHKELLEEVFLMAGCDKDKEEGR